MFARIVLLTLFLSLSSIYAIEIIEQSESVRKCIGEEAVLQVLPSEKVDSVQWYFNNEPIISANQLYYTIGYIHPENSGIYHCEISKDGTTISSEKIPVYAVSQTQIVKEPEVQPFIAGNDYHFKVETHANGIGEHYEFEYQWYANNQPLTDNSKYSGANSSILSLKNAKLDDISTKYHCLVKGLCGFAATNPKRLIDGEMFGYIEDSKIIRMCYNATEVTIDVQIDSPFKDEMKFRWRRAYVGWIEDNEQYKGTKTNKLTIKNIDLNKSTYFYLEVTINELNFKKEYGSYHIKKVFPPILEKDIPNNWLAFDHDNGDDYARVNISVDIGGTYQEQNMVNFEWYKNGELVTTDSKYPLSPTTKVYWAKTDRITGELIFGFKDFMEGIWQCRLFNDCFEVWSNKCEVKIGKPDTYICAGADTSLVFEKPILNDNESIVWYYENKKINKNNVKVIQDTILIIQNAKIDDAGEYRMMALDEYHMVRELQKRYLRIDTTVKIKNEPKSHVYLNAMNQFDEQYFCFEIYDMNFTVQLFKNGQIIFEEDRTKIYDDLFDNSFECIKVGGISKNNKGIYYVKVISDCFEFQSKPFEFIAEQKQGIISNVGDKQSELKDNLIYPNPSNGNIKIKSSENIQKIEIYDQMGKLIITNENYISGEYFEFYNISAGVYNVLIHYKNHVISKRLVVMQ